MSIASIVALTRKKPREKRSAECCEFDNTTNATREEWMYRFFGSHTTETTLINNLTH